MKNTVFGPGLMVAVVVSGLMGNVMAFGAEPVLEEVVSTPGRQVVPLADQSGNIEAIGEQELDFIKSTHFNETAVRLAGVNIARNDGQEYLASIRSPIFTGAGACGAFLMAQDGIALRSSGFCNVNEMFEGFTEQAKRIEVTKGPGTALYGSNALHGIINIVTPAADTNEGRVSFEGGANEFIRFNLSKGIVGERHGLRIQATVTHDGGYRDDSGYDQQKISLRHDYRGDEWQVASYLIGTHLDQETAGYITGKEAYKDKEISKSNPNPEAYRKAKSLRYWSQLSRSISETTRWQVTPYLRVRDMEFLMHFLPGKPIEKSRETSFGLQNGLYFNEGGRVEIIAGGDVEYAAGSLQQFQINPTEGSAFLRATIPAGKQYDYDVDSLMAAAFVQATWRLNQKWRLQTGVRLEYMKYDYTNNMLSGRTDENGVACGFGGCRYSRPESGVDDFTSLSPKISLLYHINDSHTAYMNASHGFRAPQATELYRLQRQQQVADLKEVTLKNIELGVRGQAGALTYNLSVYAMRKDNYIFRDADFFNVNQGKSDHLGSDMTVKWALNDHVSVRGNWSLARHRYAFDYISRGVNLNGLDVDSAPRSYGGLQVAWHPSASFRTEMEWVHMGSYYLDPENAHRYNGHDYLNLRGELKVGAGYRLFFRVMNVTNATYAERADYTSFTDERYFPGKPRSFYAGLDVAF